MTVSLKPKSGGAFGRKVNRVWRIIATAYCFAFFGVFAILVSATWFPLLRLSSRDAEEGRIRIQASMRYIFSFFARMMRFVGVINYEIEGLERLNRPGQLIVANHPTLIDVVLLVSFMPRVDCIVKDALWRNPFLRWPVLWAGYIPNSTAEQLVDMCAQSLKAGRSLLVFPEGTRTIPGAGLNMKRGAAQIALAARADILPVTISCRPLLLSKVQPWYDAPHGPGHFIIKVGEPIPASEYARDDLPQSLAARELTRRFQSFFTRSLADIEATPSDSAATRNSNVMSFRTPVSRTGRGRSVESSESVNEAASR